MNVTVEYKAGYRPPAGVTAEGASVVLARLLADGELTTEGVLEAAEPDESPIHGICEWDDGEAAHKFRLIQCRNFIRGITVIVGKKKAPQPLIHVPAVTRAEGSAGKYVLADVLRGRLDEWASALDEAHRAARAARARVEEIEHMIAGDDERMDVVRIALQGFDAVQGALRVLEKPRV